MKLAKRLFINISLLLLILFAPYWIYLPLGVLALCLLPFFWEGILMGFLIDIIYGAPAPFWLDFPYAIGACVVVLISIPLRKRIRINA